MSTLEELRTKLEDEVAFETSAEIGLNLIAALEAVESMLVERQKLWDAICAETCIKDMHGVDHHALADAIAASVTATITEALA